MPHARPTRILAALLLALAVAAGIGASAHGTGRSSSGGSAAPVTLRAVAHDTSGPLKAVNRGPVSMRIHAPMLNEWRERVQTVASAVNDPVVQRAPGSAHMPATSTNFDGLALSDAGGANYLPPDPTGDVGKTQYVQAVNGMLAVYTKTGSRIAGPIPNLDFWSGLGAHCDTLAAGDPTVVYDSYADRWVYSEFAFDVDSDGNAVAPYYQCVAVSTTGDATGTWHRYEFLMNTTLFPDYPKIAVWHDGYYMSVNQFDSLGFHGAGAVVFERSQMLAGASAQAQYVDVSQINPDLGGILPADADGATAPTGSAPFLSVVDDPFYDTNDRLQVWNFRVDWATPGNSSFALAGELPVSAMSTGISHVDQGLGVDAIGAGQLMYRVQWRSIAGVPTMVANHTVNAGAGQAGIRWYLLRYVAGAWTLPDQGTYAPGGADRWTGSIAADGSGNLALGYSYFDGLAPVPPSPYLTGRLTTDPAGTLPQAESAVLTSGGSQSHPSRRWGDYSHMSVDPADDCTFWYTSEYYAASAVNAWRTRIASFRYTPLQCTGAASGQPTNTTPPGFTGSAIQGLTMNATLGTWAGGVTSSAYQWRRCDGTTGLGCVDIPGATSSSYMVAAADIGSRIRVQVTATNASGSTPATSIASPVAVPQAPVNTAAPTVSGTVAVGNYLAVSNGTWTSSVPLTYSYRWERCDAAGANCVPVTGVTSSTYLLDNPDVGKRLRGVAIASNAGGAASANAAVTIAVPAPPAPTNSARPTVGGTAQVGSTLNGGGGSWSGAGTLTFASSWQRCDSAGDNCVTIPGETTGSYALTGSDAGSTIRFATAATNGGGTTTVASLPTDVVTAPISDGSSGGSGGSGSGSGGSGSGGSGSGGSGGGSGGGGSGGAPGGGPDWVVAMTLDSKPKAVGEQALVRIVINNKGGLTTKAYLDLAVPSGLTLVNQQYERGTGCLGTSTLSCYVDSMGPGMITTVLLWFRVDTKSSFVLTTATRFWETDVHPADNVATLAFDVGVTTTSGVPSGLNGSGSTSTGPDKVKPSAQALASRVSSGKSSALRFKLYDDRGVAKATATVKRDGKVLATLKTGYGPVVYGTIYFLPWKVPAKLTTGGLSFCVVATDRSGNSSRSSCAPVSLR